MAMDEEGSEIRELDRDRLRILTELRKHPHPLTHQSDSLYNIVNANGQIVSETTVNVQDAVEIGQDTTTSFAASLPGGFHHPINKTVKLLCLRRRHACWKPPILNRRRTKATHNRVKWILMNLRGRE